MMSVILAAGVRKPCAGCLLASASPLNGNFVNCSAHVLGVFTRENCGGRPSVVCGRTCDCGARCGRYIYHAGFNHSHARALFPLVSTLAKACRVVQNLVVITRRHLKQQLTGGRTGSVQLLRTWRYPLPFRRSDVDVRWALAYMCSERLEFIKPNRPSRPRLHYCNR